MLNSYIVNHFLGDEFEEAQDVRACTYMYGSTAGPFLGIAGQMMTTFTMTEIVTDRGTVLYWADEHFLGWCDWKESTTEKIRQAFPRLREDMEGLHTDKNSCPVAIP